MVETIFRIILIAVVASIILAFASTLVIAFDIRFEYTILLTSFLHVVCYILPFKKLLPIFIVVVSITVFKIGVSILKTIWDLFPFSP